MKLVAFAGVVAVALPLTAAGAETISLPPEVTPAIRAACEQDVRRLCITTNATFESVRSCVAAKFRQLGRSCQIELTLAGFSR